MKRQNWMVKASAWLLALVIVLGCGIPTTVKADEIPVQNYSAVMTEEQFQRESGASMGLSLSRAASDDVAATGLYRSNLTGWAAVIYDNIEKEGVSFDEPSAEFDIDLDPGVSSSSAWTAVKASYSQAMFAYIYDHQNQFPWASGSVGINCAMGYDYIILRCNFYSSKFYNNSVGSDVNAKIRQIASSCSGKSRYEQVLAFHDWLVKNNAYDTPVSKLSGDNGSSDYFFSHNQIGCLLKGKGVCESYSKAFKVLCQQNNIPCMIVNSASHSWNYVKMEDGKWYLVDCCWDDPVGASSSSVSRKYMLISNSPVIDSTHKPESSMIVPETARSAYSAGTASVKTTVSQTSTATTFTTAPTTSVSVPTPAVSVTAAVPFNEKGSITAVTASASGMTIKWNANAGATGYELQRKIGTGKYTTISTITDGKTTSILDTTAKVNGNLYTYRIAPMKTANGKTEKGTYSAEVANYFLTTTIRAISTSGTIQTISWVKNAKATGYEVYRSVNGGSFTRIKTIAKASTVSFKDTTATNGNQYSYRVVSYKTASGKTYTGLTSGTVTAWSIAIPKITKLVNGESRQMMVTWGMNDIAAGYEVQYSGVKKMNSGVKTLTVMGAGNTVTVIEGLPLKKNSYVRVRSFVMDGNTRVYSAWSAVKYLKIKK